MRSCQSVSSSSDFGLDVYSVIIEVSEADGRQMRNSSQERNEAQNVKSTSGADSKGNSFPR